MPTALVTGANRGLGLEVCRLLLSRDYHVTLAGRDDARLVEARQSLDAPGDRTAVLPMDVADDASTGEAVAAYSRACSSLDLLINNAGVYPRQEAGAPDTTDDLRDALEVNTIGALRVARAFRPLLDRGTDPRVVMVSSGLGSFALCAPGGEMSAMNSLAYQASKAALNMVTVSLAKEWPSIRVLAVSPGWCRTDMGGEEAPRSAQDGAATITEHALGNAPSGSFLGTDGPMDW